MMKSEGYQNVLLSAALPPSLPSSFPPPPFLSPSLPPSFPFLPFPSFPFFSPSPNLYLPVSDKSVFFKYVELKYYFVLGLTWLWFPCLVYS